MKTDLCLYLHTKPNGEVFYVGIGNKYRPYSDHHRSDFWRRTVNKYGHRVLIVIGSLTPEAAVDAERFFIRLYGRKDLGLGTLVNLTDGGDGQINMSEQTRLKLVQAGLNQIHPPKTAVTCAAISKLKMGTNNQMAGQPSPRARVILRVDRRTNQETIFANSYLAAESVSGCASKVIACCRGLRKTHKKYQWQYKL